VFAIDFQQSKLFLISSWCGKCAPIRMFAFQSHISTSNHIPKMWHYHNVILESVTIMNSDCRHPKALMKWHNVMRLLRNHTVRLCKRLGISVWTCAQKVWTAKMMFDLVNWTTTWRLSYALLLSPWTDVACKTYRVLEQWSLSPAKGDSACLNPLSNHSHIHVQPGSIKHYS
jgi:hypothetical protein